MKLIKEKNMKLINSDYSKNSELTSFNILKSGFVCQCTKTILKIEFQKFNLRLSIFAVYRNKRSAWNNP